MWIYDTRECEWHRQTHVQYGRKFKSRKDQTFDWIPIGFMSSDLQLKRVLNNIERLFNCNTYCASIFLSVLLLVVVTMSIVVLLKLRPSLDFHHSTFVSNQTYSISLEILSHADSPR